jgi:hypothetical protein
MPHTPNPLTTEARLKALIEVATAADFVAHPPDGGDVDPGDLLALRQALNRWKKLEKERTK